MDEAGKLFDIPHFLFYRAQCKKLLNAAKEKYELDLFGKDTPEMLRLETKIMNELDTLSAEDLEPKLHELCDSDILHGVPRINQALDQDAVKRSSKKHTIDFEIEQMEYQASRGANTGPRDGRARRPLKSLRTR